MKAPWFPFYPEDYDRDTADLTLEQDGLYSRMLRRAWSTSPDRCSLPADENQRARVLGVSLRILRRHRAVSDRYFVNEGSRIISLRLRKESEKATQRSEQASLNGSMGGRKKASSSKATANPELKLERSYLQETEEEESKTLSSLSASVGPADPVPPDEREDLLRENSVHRLVAAGIDSQLAEVLLAKQSAARDRIGGAA